MRVRRTQDRASENYISTEVGADPLRSVKSRSNKEMLQEINPDTYAGERFGEGQPDLHRRPTHLKLTALMSRTSYWFKRGAVLMRARSLRGHLPGQPPPPKRRTWPRRDSDMCEPQDQLTPAEICAKTYALITAALAGACVAALRGACVVSRRSGHASLRLDRQRFKLTSSIYFKQLFTIAKFQVSRI